MTIIDDYLCEHPEAHKILELHFLGYAPSANDKLTGHPEEYSASVISDFWAYDKAKGAEERKAIRNGLR